MAFASVGRTFAVKGANLSTKAGMAQYGKYALASGITGGILAEVQGGCFGNGFVSAGASALLSPVPEAMTSNPGGQTVIAAVIGGTISEATGGKFANGAVTAAFSYAFGVMVQGGGGQGSGPGDEAGEATLKVGKSRPMTAGEIAMAQEVFGDSVKYSSPNVFNMKFRFFQRRGTAMAPNGNIYFHPADYMDDFSASSIENRSWFMHEMTHVWQHQQGINVYAAVLDRRYDYRPLVLGKSFQSYGLEQQGDIVQDYFQLRNSYLPNWSGHNISEYEAVLPFKR